MSKISLIIRREYLSRVKKKSFIIMTFLTPVIVAFFYGLIFYFSYKEIKESHDQVVVVNENKTLVEPLQSGPNIRYTYSKSTLAELKKTLDRADHDYILYIPDFDPAQPAGIQLLGSKQAGMSLSNRIADDLETLIKNHKLRQSGITQQQLEALESRVVIDTKKLGDGGREEDSSAGASTIIAFVAGVLMFMFIMLYGVQVMRGVIEEKTNRIIEVMISSVKPFQLMMGKIIGIALVGLTQFLLWIILTITISTVAVGVFVGKEKAEKMAKTEIKAPGKVPAAGGQQSQSPMDNIEKSLAGLELGKILAVFLFFFLGGYLFYSSLYAAIGSAVDSETETQQFMMPVMMPLLFGYALSLSVVTNDPYGQVAFWLSVIPFTSPIAMVVRMPYGVPGWELGLSMAVLVLGFVGTVWFAARIYRVGILMYGKKASFKEMLKWFSYKG